MLHILLFSDNGQTTVLRAMLNDVMRAISLSLLRLLFLLVSFQVVVLGTGWISDSLFWTFIEVCLLHISSVSFLGFGENFHRLFPR